MTDPDPKRTTVVQTDEYAHDYAVEVLEYENGSVALEEKGKPDSFVYLYPSQIRAIKRIFRSKGHWSLE